MFFSFQVQLVQKSSLAQPCKARGCEERAGQPQGAGVSPGTGTQWLHVALWLLCFGDTSLLSLSCHDRTQVPLPAQLEFLSRFLQRCQNDEGEAAPSVALRKSGFTPRSAKPALFQEPLLPGTRTYEGRKAHRELLCPRHWGSVGRDPLRQRHLPGFPRQDVRHGSAQLMEGKN